MSEYNVLKKDIEETLDEYLSLFDVKYNNEKYTLSEYDVLKKDIEHTLDEHLSLFDQLKNAKLYAREIYRAKMKQIDSTNFSTEQKESLKELVIVRIDNFATSNSDGFDV
jgi:hypothetical protein